MEANGAVISENMSGSETTRQMSGASRQLTDHSVATRLSDLSHRFAIRLILAEKEMAANQALVSTTGQIKDCLRGLFAHMRYAARRRLLVAPVHRNYVNELFNQIDAYFGEEVPAMTAQNMTTDDDEAEGPDNDDFLLTRTERNNARQVIGPAVHDQYNRDFDGLAEQIVQTFLRLVSHYHRWHNTTEAQTTHSGLRTILSQFIASFEGTNIYNDYRPPTPSASPTASPTPGPRKDSPDSTVKN